MLDHKQILALLQGENDTELFTQAQALTRAHYGNDVYLRGIVEFSNYCRNDCHYCGLRRSHHQQSRYRLTTDHILQAVAAIAETGIGTVVLQSGDDFHYSSKKIADLICAIKAQHDLAITLSLGDRHLDELAWWRQLGADRYLLKMETFDRQLFSQLRPHSDFEQRLALIMAMQQLGYQVGSGIIVGLPGQSLASIANDIVMMTELKLDMLACGPFIAHPNTPCAEHPNGSVLLTQRVCALLRWLNPQALIPATSALEVLQSGARIQTLHCGANVIMPSFTPDTVSADYQIYPGKNALVIDIQQRLATLSAQLAKQKLTAYFGRGDAKCYHHV